MSFSVRLFSWHKLGGWLVWGTFLVIILILNVCYSFCSDDCSYGLLRGADGTLPQTRGFWEVWGVTLADSHRPVVHFFARLFTGWLGKGAFNIANTAMMGALMLLLFRLSRGTWRLGWRPLVVQVALVLLVLCKGESYLWCAGSVNYLWAGTATLAFCLMRERVERGGVGARAFVWMAPAALLCGWVQESFVLPMCFALGLWSLAHLRALTVTKVVFFGCYGIGVLLLVLGLQTGRKPEMLTAFSLSALVMTQLKIWMAAKGVWTLALCLIFMRDRLGFLRRNAFELLVVLGSLLMISVVGFNGERSLWCANLFAIAIVVREFTPPRWLAVGILAALAALAVVLVSLGVRIKANFESFTNLYLASPDGVTCHERVPCGPFARFFHQALYTWWQGDLHGRAFAGYHGRTVAPIALNRALYDNLFLRDTLCVPENRLPINGDFYTVPASNAIVMPLPADDKTDWSAMRAQVDYAFPPGLRARVQRELAARRDPPVPCGLSVQVLPTTHGRYLLIGKAPASDAHIRAVHLLPELAVPR